METESAVTTSVPAWLESILNWIKTIPDWMETKVYEPYLKGIAEEIGLEYYISPFWIVIIAFLAAIVVIVLLIMLIKAFRRMRSAANLRHAQKAARIRERNEEEARRRQYAAEQEKLRREAEKREKQELAELRRGLKYVRILTNGKEADTVLLVYRDGSEIEKTMKHEQIRDLGVKIR